MTLFYIPTYINYVTVLFNMIKIFQNKGVENVNTRPRQIHDFYTLLHWYKIYLSSILGLKLFNCMSAYIKEIKETNEKQTY